jgi:hypothetical protein
MEKLLEGKENIFSSSTERLSNGDHFVAGGVTSNDGSLLI